MDRPTLPDRLRALSRVLLERHLPEVGLALIVVALIAAPVGPQPRIETPAPVTAAVSTEPPPVEDSLRIGIPRAATAVVRAASPDDPVRLRIAALGIDLGVYPGESEARPRCRVAEFASALGRPRDGRAWTFIYAHGRPGMFGPLVTASTAQLRGARYLLWTGDGRRWEYTLERVIRHSRDVGDLSGLAPDLLILQTCETADGRGPKIYLVLRLRAAPTTDPTGANLALNAPATCS